MHASILQNVMEENVFDFFALFMNVRMRRLKSLEYARVQHEKNIYECEKYVKVKQTKISHEISFSISKFQTQVFKDVYSLV